MVETPVKAGREESSRCRTLLVSAAPLVVIDDVFQHIVSKDAPADNTLDSTEESKGGSRVTVVEMLS